jgi:hypothetical protein
MYLLKHSITKRACNKEITSFPATSAIAFSGSIYWGETYSHVFIDFILCDRAKRKAQGRKSNRRKQEQKETDNPNYTTVA